MCEFCSELNNFLAYDMSPMLDCCVNSNFYDETLAFFTTCATITTAWVAWSARNEWKKKIKFENLTKTRENLVYSIIDLIATLTPHCYQDIVVSSQSELDPKIYEKLETNNDMIAQERQKIESEIINKFKVFDKNLQLFNFYLNNKNQSLANNLIEFKDELWTFAQQVNFYIIYKFSSRFNHPNNEHLSELINKQTNGIQSKLSKIKDKQKTILNMLNRQIG